MDVGKRIKARRKELGLSAEEVAEIIGVSPATVYRYESAAIMNMKTDKLQPIAEALRTTPAYLMGWTDDPIDYENGDVLASIPQTYMEACDGDAKRAYAMMKSASEPSKKPERDVFSYENILPVQPFRIPLLGSVAAGEPIYSPEDFDVSIPINAAVRCDYALRVKGDSMKPTYLDGDIVLIRKQNTIDDGRIAVVAVGEEATLKHVYRTRNGITLVSDNLEYPPMPFVEEECDEIRIMGKPVAYLRGV